MKGVMAFITCIMFGRTLLPPLPSALKADVCFRLVVLRIGSDELTCCGIM